MKPQSVCALAFYVAVFCLACGRTAMPEKNPALTLFDPVPSKRFTAEEALSDIDYAYELITNAYSGYEIGAEQYHVQWEDNYAKARALILASRDNGTTTFESKDMTQVMKHLFYGMRDGHLAAICPDGQINLGPNFLWIFPTQYYGAAYYGTTLHDFSRAALPLDVSNDIHFQKLYNKGNETYIHGEFVELPEAQKKANDGAYTYADLRPKTDRLFELRDGGEYLYIRLGTFFHPKYKKYKANTTRLLKAYRQFRISRRIHIL